MVTENAGKRSGMRLTLNKSRKNFMRRYLTLLFLAVILVGNLSFTNKQVYLATAYCLNGKTASGIRTRRGIVAADPRRHKLGSHINIEAGAYTGRYLVADTGGRIKNRRIDVWVPSKKEARKFGKKKVYVCEYL